MKDYYLILRVDRNASSDEIKRSFRKLANFYHPDKNNSLEAESLFKEINEAYEVLSDSGSKSAYDQRLLNTPAYGRTDPGSWRSSAYRTGPSERTLFMQSMLRYTQLLFYFGCLWCFVLTVDYLLPAQVKTERVASDIGKLPRLSLMKDHHDLLVTHEGHHFPLTLGEMKFFPHDSYLRIHTSSLLAAVIKVENHDGSFVVNNLGSIYRNFSFAPVLLLLTCLVGLIYKRGLEFHVNLGIVVFLLMILNLVFLFTSRI